MNFKQKLTGFGALVLMAGFHGCYVPQSPDDAGGLQPQVNSVVVNPIVTAQMSGTSNSTTTDIFIGLPDEDSLDPGVNHIYPYYNSAAMLCGDEAIPPFGNFSVRSLEFNNIGIDDEGRIQLRASQLGSLQQEWGRVRQSLPVGPYSGALSCYLKVKSHYYGVWSGETEEELNFGVNAYCAMVPQWNPACGDPPGCHTGLHGGCSTSITPDAKTPRSLLARSASAAGRCLENIIGIPAAQARVNDTPVVHACWTFTQSCSFEVVPLDD